MNVITFLENDYKFVYIFGQFSIGLFEFLMLMMYSEYFGETYYTYSLIKCILNILFGSIMLNFYETIYTIQNHNIRTCYNFFIELLNKFNIHYIIYVHQFLVSIIGLNLLLFNYEISPFLIILYTESVFLFVCIIIGLIIKIERNVKNIQNPTVININTNDII